ncbi:hypothetical protein [Planococcus sp. 107-1]|uniref:hypothetical protein n=1 Tax=Planococcus sp. 107-1 TaxID=2908840 RepID=UPI001F1AA9C7|nr:hypothetical protein [Planococcus sp. 107-1]UJF25512.1 hypothetical protein L0M13_09535 [Planococcus sp. 107-1]
MDRTKKEQKDHASTYGFLFYSGALLLWSIYDFFVNDITGWQMPILFVGLALYLWSKVFYQQKRVKESLKIRDPEKRV